MFAVGVTRSRMFGLRLQAMRRWALPSGVAVTTAVMFGVATLGAASAATAAGAGAGADDPTTTPANNKGTGAGTGTIGDAANSAAPARFTQPGARTVQFPTGLYDEATDGATIIRIASERAKADGKRVLAMWGENNCGFCAYLSDMLFYESAACRGLIDGEYEFVKIDISKSHTRNNDVAKRYGATASHQMEDAPRLTIIDPVLDRGVGTLVGKDMLYKPMSMENIFDETKIVPFLEANIAPARPAGPVIDAAVTRAIVEDKAVWVQFMQSGCEPCRGVRAWMEAPTVRPILEKAFVVATIDVSRMTGGKSMLERFTATRPAIAPGSVLLTSKGMKHDPACELDELPTEPEGIAAWVGAIRRAAGDKRMSEADAAVLEASLTAEKR